MNARHQISSFLLTIVCLFSFLLPTLANPFTKIYAEIFPIDSTINSLNIDQLLGQLSEATPSQRLKITKQLKSFSFNNFSSKHKE
jgi:hypothetical protein